MITARNNGISLIEMMIAIALGMFVILIVTRLVVSSKLTQLTQNDAATMQDNARYAIDNITRSVKQAGYVEYDKQDAPFVLNENMSANVRGFDAKSLKATSNNIEAAFNSNNNGSDILAVRFFGSGNPADQTILNCAGFGVPAPSSQENAESERGWSIYYVANNTSGEPVLYCKFLGKDRFSAQAIAHGVESFQVLYGVDTSLPSKGLPTMFLNANGVNDLDRQIPSTELAKNTFWKKISAIKIALLLRSPSKSRADSQPTTYHLFGENYGGAGNDPGTKIDEATLPTSQQHYLRQIYSTTIYLKNPGN